MNTWNNQNRKQTILKRFFLFLFVCFFTGYFFSNVAFETEAATHSHCICGVEGCKAHSTKTFTATSSLPTKAGAYYLTQDITISSTYTPKTGTYLCLNGHSITYTGTGIAIHVKAGVSFVLTDCNKTTQTSFEYHLKEAWKKTTLNAEAINVDLFDKFPSEGTIVNVKGGILSNNATASASSFLYIAEGGSATLYGGSFVGNYHSGNGGAIESEGTLILNGANFYGNVAINDNSLKGYGGAIYSNQYGSLQLISGNLKFNYANHGGGAICVACGFTMSGGAISYNYVIGLKDICGGGVYVTHESNDGFAKLVGGQITYNRCDNEAGGGLFTENITYLGGSIQIVNNTGKNGNKNNLAIHKSSGYEIIACADVAFSKDGRVGLSSYYTPSQFNDLSISLDCKYDMSGYLIADNSLYQVISKQQKDGTYHHYLVNHHHDYTFENVDDKIVGTCKENDGLSCNAKTISIYFEIEPITYYPEKVVSTLYNEKAFCNEINGWVKIKYAGTGSTVYKNIYVIPTQVGTYSATISWGGITITKNFEIKEPHKCNGYEYSKLLKITSGTLLEGNYFLTSDVTLSGNLVIQEGTKVNICLNGHVLNLNGYHIVNNGDLQIVSCINQNHHYNIDSNNCGKLASNGSYKVNQGIITGGKAEFGGAIENNKNLVCRNIAIVGNVAMKNGSAISNKGECTLNDCTIQHNYCSTKELGSGVYNVSNSKIVVMGATTIYNNFFVSKQPSNLYLNKDQLVKLDNKKEGYKIGFTTSQKQAVVVVMNNEEYKKDDFISDLDKFVVDFSNSQISLIDFMITQQPTSENGFTVLTNGNQTSVYHWYYRKSETTSESIHNATNVLTKTEKAGQYYCVASNGSYSVTSSSVSAYQIRFKAEKEESAILGSVVLVENSSSESLRQFSAIPVKAGYLFNKWQYELNDQVYDLSVPFVVTKDMDIFAYWVEKETLLINFESVEFVYDGQAKTYPSVNNGFEFVVSYQQNGQPVTPVNAGSYDVILQRKEDGTYKEFVYKLQNGLVIEKAVCQEPIVISRNCYNGQEQMVQLQGVESFMSTTSSYCATEIGTYEMIFTLDENHIWQEGSDGIITWEIKNPEITVYTETGEKPNAIIELLNGQYVECIVDLEILQDESSIGEKSIIELKNSELFDKNEEVTYIFDMKLYQMIDGAKTEVSLQELTNGTSVKLRLLIPESIDSSKLTKIIHVHAKEDVTIYEVNAESIIDGYIEIEIDRFSQFALVTLKKDYTWFIVGISIAIVGIVAGAIAVVTKKKKRV